MKNISDNWKYMNYFLLNYYIYYYLNKQFLYIPLLWNFEAEFAFEMGKCLWTLFDTDGERERKTLSLGMLNYLTQKYF